MALAVASDGYILTIPRCGTRVAPATTHSTTVPVRDSPVLTPRLRAAGWFLLHRELPPSC